jgi:hypothetical protein
MASARLLSNAAPASAATAVVAKIKFRIFPSSWAPSSAVKRFFFVM